MNGRPGRTGRTGRTGRAGCWPDFRFLPPFLRPSRQSGSGLPLNPPPRWGRAGWGWKFAGIETFRGGKTGRAGRPLRFALAGLALLLLPGAVGDGRGTDAPRGPVAGRLLVAEVDMPDGRFAHTVIYMIFHDEEGAMGLVLNKLLGRLPLAAVLGDPPAEGAGDAPPVPLFWGGPLEADRGFVLHSPEYRRPDTVLSDRFAVTSDPVVMRDMAAGEGPRRAVIAFGYSGWGPGQLEGELAAGGWFVIDADPDLVFDDDFEGMWDRAKARREREL